MSTFLNGREFEEEVLRVARAIYGENSSIGRENIDGRERDGVIRTRDEILVVEATLEAKKEKTEFDAKKTHDVVQRLRRVNSLPVNGLLVVFREPTDIQREIEKNYRQSLRMVSFATFLSRLMDGQEYLRLRQNHRFGSIIDPRDEEDTIAKNVQYVEAPLVTTEAPKREYTPRRLARALIDGSERYLITGEFGVGKSMTLRFIFDQMRNSYSHGETRRVPIYLNLRDHAGQRRPAEALRTHCEDIGFSHPNDVVSAWKAGYVLVILDGFDEMSSPGWGRSLSKIRDYRFSAMSLVRAFISETPRNMPIVLAGRSNYFDHRTEMIKALGIGQNWIDLLVDELTPSHVQKLLKTLGSKDTVPEWLPPRPLLLSYFAAITAGLPNAHMGHFLSPAEGWDDFLDRIVSREAKQRAPMVSPDTVRLILQRLATLARREPDGLGRFSTQEMSDVFQEIAGYTPDEDAQGLLLRLPGLRPHASGDGSRSFMDSDYAGALKGGEIADYITDPFNFSQKENFRECFSSGLLAKSVAAHILRRRLSGTGLFVKSLELSIQDGLNQLSSDVIFVWSSYGGLTVDRTTIIEGCEELEIEFSDDSGDFSSLIFSECIFSSIFVDDEYDPRTLPVMKSCIVGELKAAFRPEAYPSKLIDCSIESVDGRGVTNDSVMSLDIAEGVRVLLTILRKVYSQKGASRQKAALLRGLDQRFRAFVAPVLDICMQERLCFEVKRRGIDLVAANPAERRRVSEIMARPQSSDDPAVTRCRDL